MTRFGGLTRREALGAAAAGLAIHARADSPNDQIGVSVIGVGRMGHGHVERILARDDVRIVSLCDVDQANL